MLRYEIKKVFSKSKNRIAVIVLFVILAITSILTINRVEYVDENGNSSVGISAARDLREAKNQCSYTVKKQQHKLRTAYPTILYQVEQ